MQGIVFLPQSNQTIEMEAPKPNQTKEKLNQSLHSDSGIFTTTIDQTNSDTDNLSSCSTPERKYVCPICDTILTSQHDFTLHIRSHNNEEVVEGFVCRICRKVLSSGSSLDRHVLVHSGERPFFCKFCGDSFTTNGNMHRHMRTHRGYESDGSTDSTEFNNNKVDRVEKRRFDGEDCVDSKKPRQDTVKCPVCDRTDFLSPQNLGTHLEDNHPEYPSKCELLQHKISVHQNSGSKPVVGFKDLTFVDFSSEKFPLIARRECEINLHKVSGGLRFQCRRCFRAFPCSNSLEIHETCCSQLNNGLDLSKSPVSGGDIRRVEFFNRLDLQDNSPGKFGGDGKLREQLVRVVDNPKDLADIHSILTNINVRQQLGVVKQTEVVSEAKSAADQEEETQDLFAVEFRKMKLRGEFPCRLCTAVFPNLRALKGHNRAHLNGNSNGTYHCNMCPHSSIDKAALIRHMRTHNGDRPYECSLCNYAFTTKANCERHLRNRHSKTTREEVKKSIIYHPSEDPTNEDLNRLAAKEEKAPEKLHCSTPKTKLGGSGFNVPPPEPSKLFEAIRQPFNPNKIHVKDIETLRDSSNSYNENSEDESEYEEQPLDLVLDLSQKKQRETREEQSDGETPQDLRKKPGDFPPPFNMTDILAAQQLLKNPPAALYHQATQWAQMYRNGFPPFLSNFPLNPLLFPTIPTPIPTNEDLRNKLRMQMCGGSMINDFNTTTHPAEPPPKKPDTPQTQTPPTNPQPPTPLKMVIKNGVLMPKQKQRRYRTERPFTCEHCSARFTLRSNMERHIKQQHPQFWSQRQRGNLGNPGRKPLKPQYCDLSVPNYPNHHFEEDTKEKLKFAILAQQLRNNKPPTIIKTEEQDEDCALIIDEKKLKTEEDLVPVSRLLDNASRQPFKEYFKREGEGDGEEGEDHDRAVGSEEDEDGLVASGSTSEGTDENRSESDTTVPVKKKSAYSLAPNRVSCPYCSRKFPWTSSLRRHILTHTGQKPFKCSHCPLLFTTKSNCDRHLLRKHGNSATTISNDNVNNNNNNGGDNNGSYLMRNVPERPFKCANCPSSTFSTYSNLKKHISCKHSRKGQGQGQQQSEDVKAQGYEAGSSEDEKVTHQIDTETTKAKTNDWESQLAFAKYDTNNGSGTDSLPFKCHLCEGSFGERQEALDHIQNKHASEYDLLMSKNAFDANATTPDEHSANHDDEDNEIRGKFPDYSNRKVICAFCMRRFWSAEDLRRHMRTHTGERPFTCDICKRRFTLKHSMLRHRKKHTFNKGENANCDLDFNTDDDNNERNSALKTDESDCNETGDLISNLLGLQDRSIIDKVLTASPDDAAKLLGVKNATQL